MPPSGSNLARTVPPPDCAHAETVQGSVPEQSAVSEGPPPIGGSLDQPLNTQPGSALAVRITGKPSANSVKQYGIESRFVQLMPAGFDVTVPLTMFLVSNGNVSTLSLMPVDPLNDGPPSPALGCAKTARTFLSASSVMTHVGFAGVGPDPPAVPGGPGVPSGLAVGGPVLVAGNTTMDGAQSPVQPVNVDPLSAVAVSTTLVPAAK